MPALSSSSRKEALELARRSIQLFLDTGDHLSEVPSSEDLKQPAGCFVTLRKRGELRGCVGTFDAAKPLYQNLERIAVSAAVQDTRFPPVAKSELPEVRIEISVLRPLEKIESIDEIEIGRHGIYVKYGNRSGTLLPEVAVEQKWDKIQFLMCCAREKAGLSPREIALAELFRYEVEKFKENK